MGQDDLVTEWAKCQRIKDTVVGEGSRLEEGEWINWSSNQSVKELVALSGS